MNNIKMLYFDRIDALKELMLKIQVNQKSVIFVSLGIFQRNDLSFKHIYAIDVMIF